MRHITIKYSVTNRVYDTVMRRINNFINDIKVTDPAVADGAAACWLAHNAIDIAVPNTITYKVE